MDPEHEHPEFYGWVEEFIIDKYGESHGFSELRIFWKITVDVHLAQLRIVKDVAVWIKTKPPLNSWCRIFSVPISLAVINPNIIDSGVNIHKDYIEFTGGENCYLEVEDHGLIHDIKLLARNLASKFGRSEESVLVIENASKVWAQHGENPTFNEQSKFLGRNVYLEAEVETEPENGGAIFHYPQIQENDAEGISLRDKKCLAIIFYEEPHSVKPKTSILKWQINKNFENLFREYTKNFVAEGFHSASVGQNLCENDKGPFEYLIDAIPIVPEDYESTECGDGNINLDGSFPFDTGKIIFRIGYDPHTQNTFEGNLRRLVFDPNASCPECPT